MKKLAVTVQSILLMAAFFVLEGVISSIALMGLKVPMSQMIVVSMLGQVFFFILVIIIQIGRKKSLRSIFPMAKCSLLDYFVPALIAFGYSFSMNLMENFIPYPQWFRGPVVDNSGINTWLLILSVAVIAPIVEEFLFRGIIMTRLSQAFTNKMALFLSALLFGLLHIMTGSLYTVVFAFLGGLIFALAYDKSHSLIPAIIAHSIGNLCSFAPILLPNLTNVARILISSVLLFAAILLFIWYSKHKEPVKTNP